MEIQFSNLKEFKTEFDKALSTNGYFAKTDKPLAIRSTETLYFFIKNSEKRLEIRAEVVYSGGGGAGFLFIEGQDTIKKKYSAFFSSFEPAVQPVEAPPKMVESAPVEEAKALDVEEEPLAVEAALSGEPQAAQSPSHESMPTGHKIKGKMLNVLKIDTKKGPAEKNLLADFGDLSFTKILINVFEGTTNMMVGVVKKVNYSEDNSVCSIEVAMPTTRSYEGQSLCSIEVLQCPPRGATKDNLSVDIC